MRWRRWLILTLIWILSGLPGAGRWSPAPGASAAPGCFLSLEDGRCLPPPIPADSVAAPAAQPRAASAPRDPGVLVKRRAEVSPGAFRAGLTAAGFPGAEALAVPRWWRVPVSPGQNPEAIARRLRQHPDIEVAEVDREVRIAFTPNDPYYGLYQWNLPKIRAPQAWDVVTGTSAVWIAIVDTGVDYTHPDLGSSRLWLGWDFVNNDNNPMDDHGHGTHVAGIAGANTNNGIGVAGICWGCDLLAVKVLGADGFGWDSDVASGIQYAADWGAAFGKRTIINLSLGSPDSSAILADAVSYAQSKGALIVAAAGNNGANQLFYPAAYPGVIGVAATNFSNQWAWFSNSGAHVDLAAPGVDILSTYPGGSYAWMDGTSMATPHVAGAAGLVWSVRPALTADQVCGILIRTALDLGTPGRDDYYGYGRVNAEAAVRSLLPPSGPSPGPYRVYLPLVLSASAFRCP
ncbi:Thermophilic serine proteinase [Candidatus Thermoflexus japonica]|uniref:Thermophilic serine proteinase n=1 Tax=Candidatus Thermoflexus japonica TaxID=2035417 RepID=A0A2H5Y7D7_9CHLR|nr:Thermophilic serine proteinase [Candidatus Thermoflexus japonica]